MNKKIINNTTLDIPVIQWEGTKKLKWGDFKKISSHDNKASAISAIGFQSKPLIEYIKNNNKHRFKIKDMQFYAIFIPIYSWYRKKTPKKEQVLLLKHEQGHFDLAEEITRKERKKINNYFQNKIFDVVGKSEVIAIKNSIDKVNTIRNKIESKLQEEFEIQETNYDYETNHGLNKINQKIYDKRFKKLRK